MDPNVTAGRTLSNGATEEETRFRTLTEKKGIEYQLEREQVSTGM
jgi:hypothetical protein